MLVFLVCIFIYISIVSENLGKIENQKVMRVGFYFDFIIYKIKEMAYILVIYSIYSIIYFSIVYVNCIGYNNKQ